MNADWVLGGVATAAGIFGVLAAWLMPRRVSVLRRIDDDRLLHTYISKEPVQSAMAALRRELQASIGKRIDESARGHRLTLALEQAAINLRPAEWVVIWFSVGCVLGVLLAVLGILPVAFAFAVSLAVAALLSTGVLASRRRRNRAAFIEQLAPLLMQISGSIRAGYTFAQALQAAWPQSPQPIYREVGRLLRELQLGVPMADALKHMLDRNSSEDLHLLYLAVVIHLRSGGNLTETLSSISETIRARQRIQSDIKTLTAQARVSGWVLLAIPPGLALILNLIAPDYFGPMLHATSGHIILALSAFALLCGWGIIRRITSVEV